MKTIYALILALVISMSVFAQDASITLRINMRPAIDGSAGAVFDPATEIVDVAGSFNGWPADGTLGTQLTLEDGSDSIYTCTITGLTLGTEYAFKVRIASSWAADKSEFPSGGTDRKYTPVADGEVYYSTFGSYDVTIAGIEDVAKNINSLSQYPNPANQTINFSYDLTSSSPVSLKVYNELGAEVLTLINENQIAGSYNKSFDINSLQNGLYFYVIKTDGNGQSAGKFIVQ